VKRSLVVFTRPYFIAYDGPPLLVSAARMPSSLNIVSNPVALSISLVTIPPAAVPGDFRRFLHHLRVRSLTMESIQASATALIEDKTSMDIIQFIIASTFHSILPSIFLECFRVHSVRQVRHHQDTPRSSLRWTVSGKNVARPSCLLALQIYLLARYPI